uniref:Reverse transcriptase domain-containing protein n=1 Tax=Tanacetum cinerariifolium TaxID=118510 RepID=A0A699IX70_TANCI|nr:reverse transcriptase domain-containing protein [Tanacetum cinerariifolium]
MFKQLHLNITLGEALVLMPKYQKMLKALLSNKEKLQELANIPLNENCSAVILKKLPEKLRDPGKFLIPCGFSELKCKALADLGASINLMPLSVWKQLGLPDLILTRITLELANRAICTPDRITRDVFVPVGKFTFPTDFVVIYYESDPRVPLILGRPFLRTARALIDPQFPLPYESEQGYNENYPSYPYDSSSLPQQYLCCARCGGPHMNYQCQPMNQDSYNSNSLGFDQPQPPQSPVNHPISNAHNDPLISQTTLNEQMTQLTSMCEIFCQFVQKEQEENWIEEEQAAKAQTWKLFDDDDDEESSNSLNDNISELPPFSAITLDEPVISTEEPDNSLSMGDEHLDTIPATESDQLIKSGVETLIPIPSESEGTLEHRCDVPFHDNSPPLVVSKDTIEDLSESNEEFSSIDDDSFTFDKIDYVEASPPDSELVSSEVIEIVILEVGGIKASTDNPIPSHDPIISGTPPNLTPSGENDFFSEVDAFLSVDDESTSSQFPKSNLDPEGDMLLFEAFLNDDHSFDSQTNDDQSLSDEDVPKKIYLNPLFDEEIIPMEIDPHSFNAESDLIESMPTNDSSIIIPSKIDSLFDEFTGELTLLKSILPGIDETDCHLEEEIHLTKRLVYDNSSPRPPEEFVSDNSNADIKSFSPSPVPIKDSDSHMEEIDLSLNPDEPNLRDFTKDVVEDISPTKEPQVLNILPTHPTLQLNLKFQPSSESLFAYIVWIFLPFLVYSVVP